jgi:hypothetical protein
MSTADKFADAIDGADTNKSLALKLVDIFRMINAVTIADKVVASLERIDFVETIKDLFDRSLKNQLRAWSSVQLGVHCPILCGK